MPLKKDQVGISQPAERSVLESECKCRLFANSGDVSIRREYIFGSGGDPCI